MIVFFTFCSLTRRVTIYMLASTFSGSPCKSFAQELWNKKNNNHKDGGLTCIFFAIWCLSNFLMGDQNQITFSNVSIGVLSAMASTIYTESSFIYLQNLIYFLKPLIMLLFVSMTSEASQHTHRQINQTAGRVTVQCIQGNLLCFQQWVQA